MEVNFGLTSEDYAKHRAGFPPQFFDRIQHFAIGTQNQKILDIGTGTGTLARGFARQKSIVTGLDVSQELIEQAKGLDAAENLHIDYVVGRAEEMNFAAQSFDCVTAGQCWHWFDRSTVARKIRSVLKPKGVLVIAHFDWLPIVGNLVDVTEKLILKYNSQWSMNGGTGVYPQWFTDVATAGFCDIESYTFDTLVTYTHEAWRGRIRASAGVGASLSPEKVEMFDGELKSIMAEQFPEDPQQILHRTFTLICRNSVD
ncbi:class I SAM-dependent methyltransferase [Candidatus Uabimicrobium amorphum]|uniref:Methyltransferase type 11 n=1 Tax=Uabimicrobium amorphum TaxID=2596890 RepID=A0A5S9IPN7_UABAM|nr:class I SAM-dependent methyltransferase [Candidatus Uabimicrobium amorphum]BBM84385.1 methyltransferase type 11 [Candidatus Uabimicrobium amorphum]